MTEFRINRVYTRSGDRGETGLVGGTRLSKSRLQVRCYGEVDELNSVLGVLREEVAQEGLDPNTLSASLYELLLFLQQELFDIGSELATPIGQEYAGMWKVTSEHVKVLEGFCDRYGDGLPELTSFILPGGSPSSAWFHMARTTARRAERTLVEYHEEASAEGRTPNPHLLEYLNRLSDLFFILARRILEDTGESTVLWQPERERKFPSSK